VGPPLPVKMPETDLRHQLRTDPLHLPHLIGRDAAAPAVGRRVGQIHERAMVDVEWLQRLGDLATQVRHEACSNLARESQPESSW
jgi:hypothetical protein